MLASTYLCCQLHDNTSNVLVEVEALIKRHPQDRKKLSTYMILLAATRVEKDFFNKINYHLWEIAQLTINMGLGVGGSKSKIFNESMK